MRLGLLANVALAASAAPASACYTGPLGLGFVGHTAQLANWGADNLGGFALDRRDHPGTRVLVTFYNNGLNTPRDKALLLRRQQTVRSYLLGQGVAEGDFTIAVTPRAPSKLIVAYSGGTAPPASVELTTGCGP